MKLKLMALLSLFLLLTACSPKAKKENSEATQVSLAKKVTDDEYMSELLTVFEKEKLLLSVNDNFVVTENMLNREHYEKAKKIIEFDIQLEKGIDENQALSPPNKMRTGKIIMFNNDSDMANFKKEMSDLLLLDELGVDTNDIHPILYFNEERNIVLALNQFIPESYLNKYKQLFFNPI